MAKLEGAVRQLIGWPAPQLKTCGTCGSSHREGSPCPTCTPMIRPIMGADFAPFPAGKPPCSVGMEVVFWSLVAPTIALSYVLEPLFYPRT